jgi:hypothetical protein
MKCRAVTHALEPGEQTILEIAIVNPESYFHVRRARAIELRSTFQIQAIMFDGVNQMGTDPIEAASLCDLRLDMSLLPRSILFFVRNEGPQPGCLAIEVSDGLDAEALEFDFQVVN